ncbi:oligosaccharide flippase family protein [Chryseolinea sp. T2]|uniref:lipopolysaccharide biosynthesis protein n=1 Tax=Chryseolinea sp. T2 TaxID=3129255 RepID=UPI00307880DE
MRSTVISALASWRALVNNGSERSRKAKKNIIASVVVKGAQVLINLLLVPLTINYVNTERYGVWLTLSSLVMWINFLDIGLGHGMRNKLVETSVTGDVVKGKIFVSTTYAGLAVVAGGLLLIFLMVNPLLDWQVILNAGSVPEQTLSNAVLIAFSAFCFQLVLQNINSIFMANHDPAKASLVNLAGQTLTVAVILVLAQFRTTDFLELVWILTAIPPLTLLISSIYLFRTSYAKFRPSLNLIRPAYARELLTLGGKFFLINIGVIILYQSDNILVAQIFGSKDVTTFNIAYRLFFTIVMVFTVFLLPFWSAVTDAYLKGDLEWVRRSRSKYMKLVVLLSGGCMLILALSDRIYNFWLGGAVKVPFHLSFFMAIYVIAYMVHSLHVNILNGIGKIQLQLWLVVICAVVNVVLAIVLSEIVGLPGIVISNIVIFVIMTVVLVVQCERQLAGTATGIWNR